VIGRQIVALVENRQLNTRLQPPWSNWAEQELKDASAARWR
jgi:hypothetical protein